MFVAFLPIWYAVAPRTAVLCKTSRNKKNYEPRYEKTNVQVSDTNRAVQPQKAARGLEFRI